MSKGRERSGPLLSQGWSWGVRRGAHGACGRGIHPPLPLYMPAPLPRMVRQAPTNGPYLSFIPCRRGVNGVDPCFPTQGRSWSVNSARNHSCESRNPSPPSSIYARAPSRSHGSTGSPRTGLIFPFVLSLSKGLNGVDPCFRRGGRGVYAGALMERVGGPAPSPPDVPPSFLRSLSSWKRGAGIHPFPRARRRPNRHSCPRAGIHPPHAHPQIPANNPQLTPIHFLTCVVEFPIGYDCFDCSLTKRPFGARCDGALIHAELSI